MKKGIMYFLLIAIVFSLTACSKSHRQTGTTTKATTTATSTISAKVATTTTITPTTNMLEIKAANRIDLGPQMNNNFIQEVICLDNNRLLIISYDVNYKTLILIYNISLNEFSVLKVKSSNRDYTSGCKSFSKTKNGRYIVLGEAFGVLLDSNFKFIKEFSIPKECSDFFVSPDGKKIAYYDENKGILVKNVSNNTTTLILKNETSNPSDCTSTIGYKPTGWTFDSENILYDCVGWEEYYNSGLVSINGKKKFNYGNLLNKKYLSHSNNDLLMYEEADEEGVKDIGLFNYKTKKMESIFIQKPPAQMLYSVAISPASKFIVYIKNSNYNEDGIDGEINIFDVKTKQHIFKCGNVKVDIDFITFLPSERYVIFISGGTANINPQLYIMKLKV